MLILPKEPIVDTSDSGLAFWGGMRAAQQKTASLIESAPGALSATLPGCREAR